MQDDSSVPLRLEDFDVFEPEMLPIAAIPDDLEAWSEWDEGELQGLSDSELLDELTAFRGRPWALRARRWSPKTMDPIVIVELRDGYTAVGDGRGRVSYAIGQGWTRIPAVMLVPA